MRFYGFNIKKETVIILAILAGAFFLRLYRLGFHDLWYDEVFSIIISENFWENWNPPLYFSFLNQWINLFGISEFSLRFTSLIFNLLGVYFTFLLAKRVFSARVGIFASILMSLSAFQIWYAQEARPYSLSVLLGVAATYFLYTALTEEKLRHWILFVLLSTLLFYCDTTYFGFFLFFSQLLSVLIFSRKKILGVLFFLPVFLFFLPRLPSLIAKLLYIKEGFWIPAPNLKSLVITIENFNLGYNMPPFLYQISVLLSCFLLWGCFLLAKRDMGITKKTLFILFLSFLPILLIFFVSKFFSPVYLDRGLIIFSPYYYILLGLGAEYFFGSKRFSRIIIFLLISLFAFGACGYFYDLMFTPVEHHMGAYLKKPFKPLAYYIKENFKSADIIAHTNPSSKLPLEFYIENHRDRQFFLFKSGMIDTNWNRPFLAGCRNVEVGDVDLSANSRLWLIACDWPRSGMLDENSSLVKAELDKKYFRELSINFDGLWVYRYVNSSNGIDK
ncbi:MAG: glycosyltransferase family 39 protein [Candidatus Omnitrophota bacterium]